MKQGMRGRAAWIALSLLVTVGLLSGCATKRYVRTEVGTAAGELSAKIDQQGQEVQGNTSQIGELSSVTRDHSGKIETLDTGLKATDEKAGQALSVGETAKGTAEQAASQVSSLNEQFANRNNYVVLTEERVPFKFDSWKLEDDARMVLDEMAQKVKESPDAILVLEGHTDEIGDEEYNIQLGEKRLEAVLRYLVVDKEVPMHRVSKMSFGEARPVAENDTKEGREQNRSVVMRVMGPGGNGQGMVSQAQQPVE